MTNSITSWNQYEPILIPLMINSSTIQERQTIVGLLEGRRVSTDCCSWLTDLIHCIWNAIKRFFGCQSSEGSAQDLVSNILRRSLPLWNIEISEQKGDELRQAGFEVTLRQRATLNMDQVFRWDEGYIQQIVIPGSSFQNKLREYTERGQTINDLYRNESPDRYVPMDALQERRQELLQAYLRESEKDTQLDRPDEETGARRAILQSNGFCTVAVPLDAKAALSDNLTAVAQHILPLFVREIGAN